MAIKIAHITTVDLSLRYLLLGQLRSLVNEGYEVVGISSPGPHVSIVEAAGIRHIPVAMTRRAFTPVADVRSLVDLYRVIRRERFLLVHTHTPKAGLLGRWAARLAGVPVIVHTSHGFIFHQGSPWLWRTFFVLLERLAARCANLIFSVNEEDIQVAVQEGICPPGKLVGLGGLGVDTQRFDRTQFSPSELALKRRELGIPSDAPVVGFVGRLVREKGLLELLAAARLVRARVPNARFLFVGPVDTAKPDVIRPEVANEYGVADICHFTGMRDDVPSLYPLMQLFVLPSYREGFPLSIIEASAASVPCIVTDARGCREAVEHGRNGLVVPLGDIPALADAIAELLLDPERARRMGEEGRRMALDRFDEQKVFAQVKAEYMCLLQAKGLPVPHLVQAPDGTPA